MNSKNLVVKFFCVLIMSIAVQSIHSQVTIGADSGPALGALLQLKEKDVAGNGSNSNKGFELPRVELRDRAQLFPMFEAGGTNWYIIGTQPYNKAVEDAKHTGLMVYHTGNAQIPEEGIYYWNGSQWLSTKHAASWYVQGTQQVATDNTQAIYHRGNVEIGAKASPAELTVNGTLKITNTPVLTSTTVLVVDDQGNIGEGQAIPAHAMLIQSTAKQEYKNSGTEKIAFNKGGIENAMVVTWDVHDMQTNNTMDPDYDTETFSFRKEGLYEVSGFILYDPHTNTNIKDIKDINDPGKYIAGLNLAIQVLEKDDSSQKWKNIAAARHLWSGGAVAGNSATVYVPPILRKFKAEDKIRLVFYRPSGTFGLEHGNKSASDAVWGISFVNGIDIKKGLKVVAF